MALPTSGVISAADINSIWSRSTSTMSIYDARNGVYGALNDASGLRPTAGSGSGYAWGDWYGYNHNAYYPFLTVYESEALADTNIYISINNNYGTNYVSKWYFYGGTYDVATDNGVTIRENDSVYAQWSFLGGWGDPNTNTLKRVYSTSRGFLYIGDGPTSTTVSYSFNIQSGESVYVRGIN